MALFSQLFLRNTTSPYGDFTRNSVLSFKDLDQNFIFLKERDISNISYSSDTLTINTLGGNTFTTTISGDTSPWLTNVNGIHYDTGNVGIGMSASSVNTKLQIEYDDASPERAFRIKNTNDGSQYNFRSVLSGGENLLRFDSDNTGISPLVVSSANKVGIGTNSLVPQATLHIYSTSGSQPIILVEDEANPDTTPFVIDIDGNVGVGTGTPQNKVHFKGTTGELRIKLDDDNSNDTNQLILKSDEPTYTNFLSIGTTTLNAELQFGMVGASSTSKVVGNPDDSFILASSAADSMNFINNAGVGTSDNIGFYAGKAIGTDLSANTSDIMILGDGTGRGNVGLGLSNPSEKLEVSGNTKISGTLNIGTLNTGTSVTNLGIDSNGNVVSGTTGGASGVLGISNSGGTYTYYSDFASAITDASAGDTIEMFANITETTNTTITLIDDITINGNGYTYTLDVDDTASTFTFSVASGTAYFNNIRVLRTGRTAGTTTGYALSTNTTSYIKCQGAIFENDYGRGIQAGGTSIYNAHIISYLDGIYSPFSSANVYDSIIEVTNTGKGTYLSSGTVSNCHVKSASDSAIYNGAGRVYNSVGISTGGYGIFCNGEVYNSTGQSTSGGGMLAQRMTNCIGVSSTSTGIQGEGRNCVGISISGVGGIGKFYNSTLISSSNYATGGNDGKLIGSTAKSTSSIPVLCGTDYEISNSNVTCDWNNTGGHCTTSSVLLTATLTNNKFKVANASAYCISAYVNSTWNYANNSFEGPTTPITPTLTQGITNTSDSHGNILI
jgi:hypothetical protein